MKKNSSNDPLQILNDTLLAESFEENSAIQWIAKNGRNLLLGFVAIIALFLILYRLMFGSVMKSEYDFIKAENSYQALTAKTSLAGEDEILANLDSLMKLHPELRAKYDPLIAQKLINQNNGDKALAYALPSLQRTHDENSPFYARYAETTLLVSQSKFDEALAASLNLKQAMIDNASLNQPKAFGDLLYAYNLLRIATLQQQLGLKKEELATWTEWKQHLNSKNEIQANLDNKAFKSVADAMQQGNVSFINYIETREKLLGTP